MIPLCRDTGVNETASFDVEVLEKVNAHGLGTEALVRATTALAVHIETFPTHITSLPVAVDLQCHNARLRGAPSCSMCLRGNRP